MSIFLWLLNSAIITGVLLFVVWFLYSFCPPVEKWINHHVIFPAVAASRKGAWVNNAQYWQYVSPTDHLSPRGCNPRGVPPFDWPRDDKASSVRHRGQGRHHHRGDHAQDEVPQLIAASYSRSF